MASFQGLGVQYINSTMLYKKNMMPLKSNRSDILEFLTRDNGESGESFCCMCSSGSDYGQQAKHVIPCT